MNFVQYINRFSDLINLLAILSFLAYYQRSSLAAKIIVLHVGLLFVINTFAAILAKQVINNYFLLHILTVVDLLIISVFYFRVVKFRPIFQKILVAFLLGILAFCMVDSLLISSIEKANIYSVTLASAFKIFLVVCFFVARIQNLGKEQGQPIVDWVLIEVWEDTSLQRELALQDIFSISLLLYTASSMFFFLFLNIMTKAGILGEIVYINAFFYLISSCMSFYGLWRYSKYPIEEQKNSLPKRT